MMMSRLTIALRCTGRNSEKLRRQAVAFHRHATSRYVGTQSASASSSSAPNPIIVSGTSVVGENTIDGETPGETGTKEGRRKVPKLTESLLKYYAKNPQKLKRGTFSAFLTNIKNDRKLRPRELQHLPTFLSQHKVTDEAVMELVHKLGLSALPKWSSTQLRTFLRGLDGYYVKNQGPYLALERFLDQINLSSLDMRTLGAFTQAVWRPSGRFLARLCDHVASRIDADALDIYVSFPNLSHLCEERDALSTALRHNAGAIIEKAESSPEVLGQLWKASAFLFDSVSTEAAIGDDIVRVQKLLLRRIGTLSVNDWNSVLRASLLLDRPWRRALIDALLVPEILKHGTCTRISSMQAVSWVELLTGESDVKEMLDAVIAKAIEESGSSALVRCYLAQPAEYLLNRIDWSTLHIRDADYLLRTSDEAAFARVISAAEGNAATLLPRTLAAFYVAAPENEKLMEELKARAWNLDAEMLHRLDVQLTKRNPSLAVCKLLRWRFNREMLKKEAVWNNRLQGAFTNFVAKRHLDPTVI